MADYGNNPFTSFLGDLFALHQGAGAPQGDSIASPEGAGAGAEGLAAAGAPVPNGNPLGPQAGLPGALQGAAFRRRPSPVNALGGAVPSTEPRPGASPPDQAPALPPVQQLPEAASPGAGVSPGIAPKLGEFSMPTDVAGILGPINQKYQLPPDYLGRIAGIESGFKRTADNGIAKGPFQFVDSTAKQMGLKDPFDWNQSADAAARLAVQNQSYLQSHGLKDVDGAALYLAHQQGPAGALALIQNQSLSAAEALQKAGLSPEAAAKHISQNGGNPNAPASDFVNLWASKYNGKGDYLHSTEVAGGTPAPAEGAHPALAAAFKGQNPMMALALMQALAPGLQFHPVSYDPRAVAPPAQPWQNVG